MFGFLLRAVAACTALLMAGGALAQFPAGEATSRELTLASAIDLALARNLDLIASRYELTAAQGRLTPFARFSFPRSCRASSPGRYLHSSLRSTTTR